MAAPALAAADRLRVLGVEAAEPGVVSVRVAMPDAAAVGASQFSLHFPDGQQVAARSAEPSAASGRPVRLAICVDRSGSVGAAALREARVSLSRFAQGPGAGLDMSLIGFGSTTRTLAGFGAPPDALARQIGQLAPEGGDGRTRLFEAVSGALDQLRAQATDGPRRLVVLSDGKDEGSRTGLERVIDKARADGVAIDAIGIGPVAARFAPSSLRALAERTGGRFVLARPDSADVSDALAGSAAAAAAGESVVRFAYEPDGSGRLVNETVLQLVQASGEPLRAAVPGAIAPVAPAAQPGTRPPGSAQDRDAGWKADRAGAEASGAQAGGPTPPAWSRLSGATLAAALAGLSAALAAWLGFVMLRRSRAERQARATPEGPAVAAGAGGMAEPVRPPPPPAPPPPRAAERKTRMAGPVFAAPRAEQPAAFLVGVGGAASGRSVPIDRDLLRIGAGSANELRLDADEYVSTEHACIRYESGGLYVIDRQSRNGTFLNDARVADTAPLQPGDRLRVGRSVWRLEAAAGARAPEADRPDWADAAQRP